MSIEEHKRIIRRYYEELWNHWNSALADQLLALEVKFRGNAALAQSSDRVEGVIRSVYRLSAGEPLADLLASLTPEGTRS